MNYFHYNSGEVRILFRDKLKLLRKERGITQEDLAKILGVERSSIGKYEGKQGIIPSPDVLNKIADYFCVSIDYLLDRTTPGGETGDEEIWNLREELRRNPELNMLFSIAKGATKDDIIKTVKILRTLKGDEE